MGDETGADDERPGHEVFVNSFLIGKFTVTNEEFDHFRREAGYSFPALFRNDSNFSHARQPAVGVNWHDAITYCRWLSETTGKSFRLPTEAEWEYAARAGSAENTYPWGKQGWNERSDLHTRFHNGPEPVGSFQPNAYGVYEAGMNVHEWCIDWYHPRYYQDSPISNPAGPKSGTRRASRGGSWRHSIKITRCAARSSIPPDYRYADYGFRIVCPDPPVAPLRHIGVVKG